MNILHVISSMNPIHGGLTQALRNTIPELQKINANNRVVSLDDPSSSFLPGDIVVTVALGEGKGPWRYNRQLLKFLVGELSRYDVVVVHGLWLYHSYATLRAIRFLRADRSQNVPRLFVMPHGMLDPWFQRAPERRWKAFRNRIYWNLVERHIINAADGILFTCQEELMLARSTFYNYSPRRELNIGLGVPATPRYTSNMQNEFYRKCPMRRNDGYFLFLGRIDRKKGVELLIKAYTRLVATGIDLPKLVIGGPGLQSFYGATVKSTASILPNNILFPGMLTGDAKWGAFYGCEAFILPSHQENFGIAVVEALACAKPVLITDKVNIWREVQSEGAGIIGTDSERGVYQLLVDFMKMSREERLEIGCRAKKCFQKYFTVENNAARMLKAFSDNV